jgi:hypothetical protein
MTSKVGETRSFLEKLKHRICKECIKVFLKTFSAIFEDYIYWGPKTGLSKH